ncbi:MAG: hypothetical protein LBF15_01140 [Candidatus Peribacteria bacterium]|jgi:hypothetical protein|nr:hypothetical protein [Candidatus Peribacteria bacterium]
MLKEMLPIIITGIFMVLIIAFLIRTTYQSGIVRLLISYIVAIIPSSWLIYYFKTPIEAFTAENLQPIKFIRNIYGLFDFNVSFLFIESFLTVIVFLLILYFMIIHYLSDRRFFGLGFMIIVAFMIVNVLITPFLMDLILNLLAK